jgi:F0F1-type ATP synthase gamma subunit
VNNSEQLLKKLEQAYNRNRQQHITNELIEIIAGSEAI